MKVCVFLINYTHYVDDDHHNGYNIVAIFDSEEKAKKWKEENPKRKVEGPEELTIEWPEIKEMEVK